MNDVSTFVLFGGVHLIALGLIAATCIGVARLPRSTGVSHTAQFIAYSLLVLVLFKPVLFISFYGEPWAQSLPLALCRINEFLVIVLLLKRSHRIFEISYFLTVGSIAALLMPDLPFSFPDPKFILFFLSHGLAVVAMVYAVFDYGFRPTLGSVRKVLIFLGVYTALIAGMNVLLDSNYLFLRAKPQGASVLDYLGPWPIYVIALIALAIGLCYLCYLPFAPGAKGANSQRA